MFVNINIPLKKSSSARISNVISSPWTQLLFFLIISLSYALIKKKKCPHLKMGGVVDSKDLSLKHSDHSCSHICMIFKYVLSRNVLLGVFRKSNGLG